MLNVVIKNNKKPTNYPCLKISKAYGSVVLFVKAGVGVVVSCGDSSHEIGYWLGGWDESGFDIFEGTIELSNVVK